ncbi:transglutaminase family protein, partial [Methylobacterium sp. WL7]|uniref:transglutaminase-like domain-containing protein n=1 Tax=Methylobacterium sp. WL7 TaxID=2603900 RepID=UPI0011C9018E
TTFSVEALSTVRVERRVPPEPEAGQPWERVRDAVVAGCGLRGMGLPAAYVSGYLRTVPPPGRPRLRGADASHAWVAVWCGDGWLGLDPTNGVAVRDDHIVVARGRDYGDVAPVDGIVSGSGKQRLK